jgi:hypothetical protein
MPYKAQITLRIAYLTIFLYIKPILLKQLGKDKKNLYFYNL